MRRYISIFVAAYLLSAIASISSAHASLLDRVFVPVQKVIISQINKQISGSLDIGSMRLYPPNRVTLSNVRFFENKTQDRLIAQIEKLEISLSLIQLAYGSVQISSVKIVRPFFFLEITDSDTNIMRALDIVGEETSDQPVSLTIPNISLQNGVFEFVTDSNFDMASYDVSVNAHIEVKKGKLRISATQVKSGYGHLETTGMSFPYTNFIAKSAIVTEDWVSTTGLNALVEGSRVFARGSLNYTNERFNINGEIDTPAHFYPNGLTRLPFATPAVRGSFSLKGMFTEPLIDVRGTTGAFEVYGTQFLHAAFATHINIHEVVVNNAVLSPTDGGEIGATARYKIDTESISLSAILSNVSVIKSLGSFGVTVPGEGKLSGNLDLNGHLFFNSPLACNFEGSLTEAGAFGVVLPKHLRLRANFILNNRNLLNVTRFDLRSAMLDAEMSGKYDVSSNDFSFNFSTVVEKSKGFYAPIDSVVQASGLRAQGIFSGRGGKVQLNSLISIAEAATVGLPITGIEAEFTANDREISLQKFSSFLGGGSFSGAGKMSLLGRKEISAFLELSTVYINSLNIDNNPVPISGEFNSKLSIGGTSESPQIDFAMTGSKLLAYDIAIPRFQAVAHLKNNELHVTELDASLMKGSVSSKSLLINLNSKQIKTTLSVKDLELGKIKPLALWQLSGQATGKVIVSGRLTSPSIDAQLRLRSINFQGTSLGEGKAFFLAKKDSYEISALLQGQNSSLQYRAAYDTKHGNLNTEADLNNILVKTPVSWPKDIVVPLQGIISGKLVAQGKLGHPDVKANLRIDDIRPISVQSAYPGESSEAIFEEPLAIDASFSKEILDIKANTHAKPRSCTQSPCVDVHLHGRVSSLESFSAKIRGELNLSRLETFVTYFQKEVISAGTSLSLSLNLSKKKANIPLTYYGSLQLNTLDFSVPTVPAISLSSPTLIEFSNDSLWFTGDTFFISDENPISVVGGIKQKQYALTIEGNIPLVLGKFLTPAITGGEGAAQAQLSLSGTPDMPIPEGKFTPRRGSTINFRSSVEPIIFTGGSAYFSYLPQEQAIKLDADRLSATYGDGLFIIDGNALLALSSLAHPPLVFMGPALLNITAENMLLKLPELWINTNFEATLTVGNKGTPVFSGAATILDGVYQDKFTFNNFVISRNEKPRFSFDFLPLVELDVRIAVENLSAKADTPLCNLDVGLSAEFQITNNSHSPYLKGRVDLLEGQIKFPQAIFQIEPSTMAVSGYPGKMDAKLNIRAQGELNPLKVEVRETTGVELSLKGDLNSAKFDFIPISGNRSLNRSAIIGRLSDPGQFLLGSFREQVEQLLTGKSGSRPSLTTSVKDSRIAAQIEWQIGPRLELEGTAAASPNIQFEDFRLRLLIFDHLPVGKSFAVEGEFLSPSSVSKNDPSEQRIKLKYRILEK